MALIIISETTGIFQKQRDKVWTCNDFEIILVFIMLTVIIIYYYHPKFLICFADAPVDTGIDTAHFQRPSRPSPLPETHRPRVSTTRFWTAKGRTEGGRRRGRRNEGVGMTGSGKSHQGQLLLPIRYVSTPETGASLLLKPSLDCCVDPEAHRDHLSLICVS